MELKRSGLNQLWMSGLYVLLSFLSYYCCCYRLPVSVKYIVNVLVAGWAVLAFMIKPREADAKHCLRFLLLFCVTYLIPWVWSLLIWIFKLKDFSYIMRGSLNIGYMITCMAYVCASYYLFGERAVPLSLIAMAAANGAVFLEVGMKNGFGPLLQQYLRLVTTFAGKTGTVIRKMELHDVVFGWGVFIIYYAMHKTPRAWERWLCLIVSVFFFTLGFKRIGVIAVVMALGVVFLYQRLGEHGRKHMLRIVFFALTAIAFCYIYMVRSGLLFKLTAALNLNLMGREAIYSSYNDFYTISPFYTGQGMRFIFQYGSTVSGITALHNDLLGLFIEVGFIPWFVWMWYEFYIRGRRIATRYSYDAAANLLAGTIYLFVTFMTDNTFYYYPINVIYRLTAMAWCLDAYQKTDARQESPSRRGLL